MEYGVLTSRGPCKTFPNFTLSASGWMAFGRFFFHSDMLPPDSLALANEFLCGVVETLDQQCSDSAEQPDTNALASAAHATRMARSLVEHALTRLRS